MLLIIPFIGWFCCTKPGFSRYPFCYSLLLIPQTNYLGISHSTFLWANCQTCSVSSFKMTERALKRSVRWLFKQGPSKCGLSVNWVCTWFSLSHREKGRGRGGESERDILRALSLPPPVLTQQTCDKLYLRCLTTSPSNLLQLPLSGPGRAQRHTQPGLRSLRWPVRVVHAVLL